MKELNEKWWSIGYTVQRKRSITSEGDVERRIIKRPDDSIVATFGDEEAAFKREQARAATHYY